MGRPWKISLAILSAASCPRLLLIDRRGFSQDRMSYIQEESKVLYQSKDGKKEKIFDALEWPRR